MILETKKPERSRKCFSVFLNTINGCLTTPEWTRYFPADSAPKLVSGVKSTMRLAGTQWNEHLTNIKKGSDKNNTIKV